MVALCSAPTVVDRYSGVYVGRGGVPLPDVSVRAVFGHAAASLESARESLQVQRPASTRQMARQFGADVVFDEPIVTDGGVALGGHHTLVVSRDGTYRYKGSFRATGLPSYDVAIVTTLGYPIAVPGSPTPAAGQVAFAAHGRVHGSNEPGDREFGWDDGGSAQIVASEWSGVRQAQLNYQLDYDTDWFGPAGDVVSFVTQVAAFGATFGAAGVAIVLVGKSAELLNIEQLVLPGTVGVILSGAAAFVLGPGVLIPAFLVGVGVTAALVKQRHLEPHERSWSDRVFQGKVPWERVLLTNLLGLGERPFTTPGPGGVILVNMGEGFAEPLSYTGKGATTTGNNAPGQLLVHELVHAWQIANETFTPEYYCRAVSTAAGTLGGDMSAYGYGGATGDWRSFGTERQASIVDEWFAGSSSQDSRHVLQRPYPPMHHEQTPNPNPYYRFIRDNIRTGIA